jgi:endonuclease III
VKNASLCAKKLNALLKKIGHVKPPEFPSPGDPIAVLVMSMLLWESTTEKAMAAYARLLEHVVDFNDLRVCMPHETMEIIGQRFPRALDRCQRLRAVLRNVYLREHAVNLDSLSETGKRDAKKYIESLEGIVPYAAARVLLLSFHTHAIPVDDQLRTQLIEAEVSDSSMEIPELSSWLASQIRAEDGAAAHDALQSWIDDIADGRKVGPKRSSSRRPGHKRESRSSARAG